MVSTTTILIFASCMSVFPTGDLDAPKPEAVREAVVKALPLILKSTNQYSEKRDCFSCHHQAVPVLALSTAREHGFAVPAEAIEDPLEHTENDLRGALDSYRKGKGQPGDINRAGYALFTLDVGGIKPNEVTDAVAEYLLQKEEPRGYWRGSADRPPSEASEFMSNYLIIRALTAYGTEGRKDRVAVRVEKTRRWLESARPRDTEDRVFRLLALQAVSAPEASIREASNDLASTHRDDGGWSQLDGGKSDAYATGSALAALHLAGRMATDSRVYRGGLKFLIDDQREDGSWFVTSRSKPFQPYFESGFPYGKDQFISMAATSWAVTALSLADPKK